MFEHGWNTASWNNQDSTAIIKALGLNLIAFIVHLKHIQVN